VRYPAFRPRGQEIQVGDLIRSEHYDSIGLPPTGLVCRILDEDFVEVLLGSGLYIAAKKILEVISEAR